MFAFLNFGCHVCLVCLQQYSSSSDVIRYHTPRQGSFTEAAPHHSCAYRGLLLRYTTTAVGQVTDGHISRWPFFLEHVDVHTLPVCVLVRSRRQTTAGPRRIVMATSCVQSIQNDIIIKNGALSNF